MGLNLIFVIIVVVTSIITILQTASDPVRNSRRWIPIAIGLLICTIVSLLFWHNYAGYISIVAWVILAIIPSLGFRFSDRLFYQGNFEGARRVKSYLRWLHPLADWRWQDALYRAYDQARQGKYQEGAELLALAQQQPPTLDQACTLLQFQQDWSGLVAWWENYPNRTEIEKRLDLTCYYLRALGELGERNRLFQFMHNHYPAFSSTPPLQEYCFLYAFTFGGCVEQTNRLLHAAVLESINPDMRTIWIATAHDVAGNREMANALLKPLLRTTKDGIVRRFAEHRLHYPLLDKSEELTKESKLFLKHLERDWGAKQRMASLWQ